MRHVFVQPSGQDDNLGDSALRAGLLAALRAPGVRLHLNLEGQTDDYVAGIPLHPEDRLHKSRSAWLGACESVDRPVYVLNAGEINPARSGRFPHPDRVAEMRAVRRKGGLLIAAGIGLKDPSVASSVSFHSILRGAGVVSWRDHGSRDGAGFGDVAPDWAFALGADTSCWTDRADRQVLAVTLRFDRPLPPPAWYEGVRSLAVAWGVRIVTVAQVARDSPRAVGLATALGGEYLVAPSTRHDDLDRHVRSVYASASAVVSDRAHALIMGATEGAYPIGSAADPQKIERVLRAASIDNLTGSHESMAERAMRLHEVVPSLVPSIDGARHRLRQLTARLRTTIDAAS